MKVAQARGMGALVSKTGGWLPMCMAIDMPPFDDVRVRQAMRLIVDRPAMLEQVASGYGFVGNDLYAPFDPGYDHSLPQRQQDIDQAKSLLKAAGQANLSVDLHTTNGAAGMVETATVFANQASAAGVKINVHQRPELLRQPVPQAGLLDRLLGHPRVPQPGAAGLAAELPVQRDALAAEVGHRVQLRVAVQPGPGRNRRGQAHPDRCTRCSRLEYNVGGYIIPFFGDLIDGYAAKVKGLKPSKGTLNLDSFGHGYRTIWFS